MLLSGLILFAVTLMTFPEFSPIRPKELDVIALVQAIFTGIIGLVSALGAFYAIVAAARAKRAELAAKAAIADVVLVSAEVASVAADVGMVNTKIDGMLEKRDKDNVEKGERAATAVSDTKAETLALGQKQGFEMALAASAAAPAASALPHGISAGTEVAVTDARVGKSTDEISRAIKSAADTMAASAAETSKAATEAAAKK